jgi:membrane protein involved in colicin uptake
MGAGVVHSEDIHHAADDLKEERDDELEELLMQSVEENGKGLQGFRKTLTQDKFKALHGWKAAGLKTKYYSIINKRKAEAQKKSSDSNSKAANAEKKSEETKKVYELGSSNSDSSESGSKAAKKATKKAVKKAVKEAAKKAATAAAKAAKKRYKNKDKAKTRVGHRFGSGSVQNP